MSIIQRQSAICSRVCQYLASIALLLLCVTANAGEVSVERQGNGIDILQDSTLDPDSRSSDTAAAGEELLHPEPIREYMGPLADVFVGQRHPESCC